MRNKKDSESPFLKVCVAQILDFCFFLLIVPSNFNPLQKSTLPPKKRCLQEVSLVIKA